MQQSTDSDDSSTSTQATSCEELAANQSILPYLESPSGRLTCSLKDKQTVISPRQTHERLCQLMGAKKEAQTV